MAGSKEIRTKIKSVENTRKITRAMEMVAAAKMRKAQERMRAARPYAEKIRNVAAHLSRANPEYKHPFLVKRDSIKNVGVIVVTSDKGLCGGLNTNVLRLAVTRMKEWEGEGKGIAGLRDRQQGLRLHEPRRRQGQIEPDRPRRHTAHREIDRRREDHAGRLCCRRDRRHLLELQPLHQHDEAGAAHRTTVAAQRRTRSARPSGSWDYIYEPDAKKVIDELLVRYIESLVYQAVVENMASEQSSRMVAMKSASDNAKSVIARAQTGLQQSASSSDHQGNFRDRRWRSSSLRINLDGESENESRKDCSVYRRGG